MRRNVIAMVGLALALVAFVALCLAGVGAIFVVATFLAVPALLISLMALRSRPRRVAVLGVCIAGFVCLYLPTMIVSLR